MSNVLLLAAALTLGQVPTPPASFTLNDSIYGDVVVARYAPNLWTGVKVVTLPANPCCAGPVTFALRYSVIGDTSRHWRIVTQYKVANFTTRCPIASTPSDAPNTACWIDIDVAARNPLSGNYSTTIGVNGTVPGSQCWPAFRNVTLSLILP